jgi:cytoskeletal protein RodZ
MSYDEEQAKRSRVVVETPTERREVVHTQSVRTPDRSGVSAGMVGVLVVVAIALITMLVLFWMSTQPTVDNANMQAQQQPPTVVQQPAPAQQPPVIIQQPAPATTQPAPVIIQQPAPAGGETAVPENIDSTLQAAIDKTLADDPMLSTMGITATVLDGKVTLLGQVKTDAAKAQVGKVITRIKGVKSVDNQITVVGE